MAELVPSPHINGVVTAVPRAHPDSRGRFCETYRRGWFPAGREMVQGNLSDKQEGAVVGLHYHLHQADYWFAIAGRARVVLHDLREGSPTEGANHVVEIGSENPVGLFIPPGVAHGFASLTDVVLTYLVDAFYNPADELGLAWDDPEVGADWGLTDPVLSDRDRKNPSRAGIPAGRRPYWGLRT